MIFAVTFLTSVALRFLPGGSDVVVALKTGPGATPEQAQAVKEELGLDKPIVVQYVDWMKNFVTGDWGFTFQTNQSIKTEVVTGTADLGVHHGLRPVAVAAVRGAGGDVVGVPTGLEVRPDRQPRRRSGCCRLPNYIVAPVLILLFSVQRNGSRSRRSTRASVIRSPTSRRSCFRS